MKKQIAEVFVISLLALTLTTLAKAESPGDVRRSKASTAKATTRTSSKSDSTQAISSPTAPLPTGPTGLGSIKLGITKEALTALSIDEPVRVVGELMPKVEKTVSPPGTERFDGMVSMPLSTNSVKATFTFKEGLLQDISFTANGEDILLERLAKQVADRYGPGKIEDSRKDEQCIYRNGNSFTLKSGMISTTWITPTDDGKVAKTDYTEVEINSCPSNLLNGSKIGVKVKFFSIQSADKEAPASKKGLF